MGPMNCVHVQLQLVPIFRKGKAKSQNSPVTSLSHRRHEVFLTPDFANLLKAYVNMLHS